ncbi:MAG: glycosyltransferase [Burkholderiales bacterium]|nr:glycosyltransferase [Burkholderiales bacterium]
MTAVHDLLLMLLVLLAVPVAAVSLYLLLATLLSGRPVPTLAPQPAALRQRRFDVIVPAHDEAAVITDVVASLRRLDWPADCFRIWVIADNCRDATAALARAAGAEVQERSHPTLRGKGHALAWTFEASRLRGWAEAVVVVDADSAVSPNLLAAFSARIGQGAGAMQAHHRVLNPQASWRTRLMAIAMTAIHQVRSRGRERLGLSCGIRGNGWCVTHRVLLQVPYCAYSLAEDIEYGITLGLAGQRVFYVDEAAVAGLMVSSERAARSQRERWEQGRWQLVRSRTTTLLRAAPGAGGRVCLDLALDLLVPPLSQVAVGIVLLIGLAGLASLLDAALLTWLWVGLACGACLMLYVLRGWQLSGVGWRGLVDLLRAPFFVVWKLALLLRARGSGVWVRTRREHS